MTTVVTPRADYFGLAERYLPGAGVGAFSLPDEVRFVAVRAEGSRIHTADGRVLIDYVNGAGANILGNCPPKVVEAIRHQATRGLHYFAHHNDVALELAEKLVEHIPCADKVLFSTTGSEATLYAMRIARAVTGRTKVLKFEGAYHGNHDYAVMSIFPEEPTNYPIPAPTYPAVPRQVQETMLVAPYNDLETVAAIVAEQSHEIAAVIVEPTQRIIRAQPGFLEGLRAICDHYDIVLIFDEVVTGFRLALGGAQEFYGVKPDLACYGKIIGGGGPLSCVAGRADLIEAASPRRQGDADYAWVNGTFHGNPLLAAAGLATIRELEHPGFYGRLTDRTRALLTLLQSVLDGHGVAARAVGHASFWQLLAMDVDPVNEMDIINSDRDRIRQLDLELFKRDVFVLPDTRRFVSAAHSEEDFERTAEALASACQTLR